MICLQEISESQLQTDVSNLNMYTHGNILHQIFSEIHIVLKLKNNAETIMLQFTESKTVINIPLDPLLS